MARSDFDELHTTIGERLSRSGQRYTRTRRRLIEVMVAAGRPLTLPEIVAAAPDLAQSSAYRNLDVLEQATVVSRVSGGSDHTHFELADPPMPRR